MHLEGETFEFARMKRSKWILFGLALGIMASTATFVAKLRGSERLGPPGVRIGPVPFYDAAGKLVSDHSAILPETVLGAKSDAVPFTGVELSNLPADTTFGRRRYLVDDNFAPIIAVVLMGTDRNSIHQPEFCLVGQGWTLDHKDEVSLRIDKPYPYDISAIKFTTSMETFGPHQEAMLVQGIYVYWFVTEDKITSDHASRLWSIAQTMIQKKELERWAYISYFVTCLPGQEKATYSRLEQFIKSSVPDFQIVTGQPAGRLPPVAARE
jgi:hypothetical protein